MAGVVARVRGLACRHGGQVSSSSTTTERQIATGTRGALFSDGYARRHRQNVRGPHDAGGPARHAPSSSCIPGYRAGCGPLDSQGGCGEWGAVLQVTPYVCVCARVGLRYKSCRPHTLITVNHKICTCSHRASARALSPFHPEPDACAPPVRGGPDASRNESRMATCVSIKKRHF